MHFVCMRHNSHTPGEGPLQFSCQLEEVNGIWHILLTWALLRGGRRYQHGVFTRPAPSPGAPSLKVWWSCSHSFWGSPLPYLNFPLKLSRTSSLWLGPGARQVPVITSPGPPLTSPAMSHKQQPLAALWIFQGNWDQGSCWTLWGENCDASQLNFQGLYLHSTSRYWHAVFSPEVGNMSPILT